MKMSGEKKRKRKGTIEWRDEGAKNTEKDGGSHGLRGEMTCGERAGQSTREGGDMHSIRN